MSKFESINQFGGVLFKLGIGKLGAGRHTPFTDKQPVSGPIRDFFPNLGHTVVHEPLGIPAFEAPNEVLVPVMPHVGIFRRRRELLPLIGRPGVLLPKDGRVDQDAIVASGSNEVVNSSVVILQLVCIDAHWLVQQVKTEESGRVLVTGRQCGGQLDRVLNVLIVTAPV